QVVASALAGAALFIGFQLLWRDLPWVAMALAVVVIVGLVAMVRVLRRSNDWVSIALAVIVGLGVTCGPLLLRAITYRPLPQHDTAPPAPDGAGGARWPPVPCRCAAAAPVPTDALPLCPPCGGLRCGSGPFRQRIPSGRAGTGAGPAEREGAARACGSVGPMTRIAVVGGGRIGEALISGLREAGTPPQDIVVIEAVEARAAELSRKYNILSTGLEIG